MMREFSDRIPDEPSSARILARAGMAIFAIVALIAASALWTNSNRPAALSVNLAELEKQFDENPATGLARFGSRPLQVRATVRSIDETSVELDTVFMLPVTAEFTSPPAGVVRGPIVLECSGVESVAIGGGYKPKLLGCEALSQPAVGSSTAG